MWSLRRSPPLPRPPHTSHPPVPPTPSPRPHSPDPTPPVEAGCHTKCFAGGKEGEGKKKKKNKTSVVAKVPSLLEVLCTCEHLLRMLANFRLFNFHIFV